MKSLSDDGGKCKTADSRPSHYHSETIKSFRSRLLHFFLKIKKIFRALFFRFEKKVSSHLFRWRNRLPGDVWRFPPPPLGRGAAGFHTWNLFNFFFFWGLTGSRRGGDGLRGWRRCQLSHPPSLISRYFGRWHRLPERFFFYWIRTVKCDPSWCTSARLLCGSRINWNSIKSGILSWNLLSLRVL